MINHPIKELVNESYMPITSGESTILARFIREYGSEKDKENKLNFTDYFESQRGKLLSNLWVKAYYSSSLSPMNKRFLKMSVTKHISSHPSKIGKDKTFYFLGKRYTKVNELKKLCEYYNWDKTEDPSKADFLILGENLTWNETSFNSDLHLPVVMDESIRVQYHFLFNVESSATEIDQNTVASFLNNGDYDHFKMVVSMIQFLKEDALNSENKFRLIRAYVRAFTNTTFDISNKEHVWISDTVQKYCHPYHRIFVTKSFLCHTKFKGWKTEYIKGIYHPILYLGNVIGNSYRYDFTYIHTSPDMNLVSRDDIETCNSFSELKPLNFSTKTDYTYLDCSALFEYNLFKVKISLYELHNISMFVQKKSDKLEIICTGIDATESSYSSPSQNAFLYIDKDKWEHNYESQILPLLYNILESCEIVNGNIKVKNDNYFNYVVKLDEIYSSLYISKSEELEFLHMSKFKRRKTALSTL